MGWKGTLRSIGAASRQMERQSMRRSKELEKRRKLYEKMQELERAAYEVDVYENYIDRMISIHKDCGPNYDWPEILKKAPPSEPLREYGYERIAKQNLDRYKPGFFDRIFKIEGKKRNRLEVKIEMAVKEDEKIYNDQLKQYKLVLDDYNEVQTITKNIIVGNPEYYEKAINEFSPLAEITEIGASLEYLFQSPKRIKIVLHVHGEQIIPKQIKSLLKSGKLSAKDMPIGRYNELYQDYVCSSTLRVGRELFALLPIEEVVVTAKGNILNQSTGRLEDQPLLSVFLIRETMNMINFELIDPSDCMKNFKHNMGFKKSVGMTAVSEVG